MCRSRPFTLCSAFARQSLSGKHLIWTTQKLVVSELIFIQKRTNYPEGWLIYKLYQDFGAKDRFTVVNAAALGKQKL